MNEPPNEGATPQALEDKGDLLLVLDAVKDAVVPLGEDYSDHLNDFELLRDRLVAGQFRLAVLGQFKRGKSTLLNALLGDQLLPTDILPVTAIPTFIGSGEQITVQVTFESGAPSVSFDPESGQSLSDFLNEYVTEAGNPQNQRKVERVDISHPAELLQQGVVLIDTPGIGSTHKHNTEVAYQILPQCDAALFLVSPDPPITEAELTYLKDIQQRLPRTFFLLNKVDFLDETERVSSLRFLADQLAPLCDGIPQVLPISARKGLDARRNGDVDSWRESGMQQVEQNLIDFFAREKQQILHVSLSRRICDQLNGTIMQLKLSLSALMMPESELKQRIEQFRQSLPAIEREKEAAADVLAGDLKRIVKRLNSEVELLRSRAKEAILSPLEDYIRTISDTEELERLVRESVVEEIPAFFTPVIREITAIIEEEATEFLVLHQQRSNQLIEQVRQIAAELFDIPYHAPSAGRSYTTFEVSGWSNDLFISDMDPLGQRISRRFFTRKFRRKRTVARLRAEVLKLVNQNVEQIGWALRRGLDESFRKFGAELSEQLDKTIVASRKAMEIALEKSASHSQQTAGREIELTQTLSKLEEIHKQLDC
jgi:GTPase SAR1 family protein